MTMRIFTNEELSDLYVNLRDQVETLAGGPAALRRIIRIPRGPRPRTDAKYFEHLTWTVFKSGITAAVVDNKWREFRRAFAGFSPEKVARFAGRDVRRLMANRGIIRYRAKIEATIYNAGAFLVLRRDARSFRSYLRGFDRFGQGRLYRDLRARFRHLGPYGVRTFLRRVGEDVFFAHRDTLRVLYRLGLTPSPRASDEEVGRAHAMIVDANPGARLDEVNRLLTRHGSGYELREAICADSPKCYRCQLSHWCWYYAEVRADTERLVSDGAALLQDRERVLDR